MNNTLTTKGMDKKKLIHTAVILALMFLFRFLPAFGPITQDGMAVLGIFFGCIYAWTIGEIFWPSILALVLTGFIGENSVGGVFTAAFGNATLHMIVLALAFCYAVEKSGLIELIAKYILSRKFSRKGPWSLALAFWIATAVTSAVTTATTAIIILCWEMFYEVVRKANMEKKSPYTAVVIIGILVAAYLGGIVMPYTAFTQICFGVLKATDPTLVVGFVPYVIIMIVLNIVCIALMYVVCKYLLRIKVDYEIPEDLVSADDLAITRKHKIISAYILVFCLVLILPNFLPAELAVTKLLSNLGFTGSLAVILVILSLTNDGEGSKMFNFVESLKVGMPYGMVVLVATALLVSGKLTDASTGIPTVLSNILMPITSIESPVLSVAILMIIGIVLTNIINNIVCITIMVPVGITLLQNVDYNPAAMITLFCLVLLQGIVLPSSSMAGAMLHGNSEWISPKNIYKYGCILELIVALAVAVVGVPLAPVIFSLFA